MKRTATQTTTATLAHLLRAADTQRPVTITYLKEETREVIAVNGKGVATRRTVKTGRMVETLRTIEIYDVHTTSKGDIVIKAMDRESGESRTFRLDRIAAYTLHRGTYQIERPTEETPVAPAAPLTVEELIARELDRDERTVRASAALAA